MTTPLLDPVTAARLTRFAQAGAVALVACAAGAFAILPGRSAQPAPADLKVPVAEEPKEESKPVAAEPVDLAGVAERLAMVSNHPKVPEPVSAPNAEAGRDGATPAPGVPEVKDPVRYLGPVQMGGLRLALVTEGNRQRFARLGAELTEGTLKLIEDQRITLDAKGTDKVIELAPKTSDVVTRASGAGSQPFIPGVTPNQPNRFPPQAMVQNVNPAVRVKGQPAGMNRAMPVPQPPGSPFPGNLSPERVQRLQEMRDKMRANGKYANDEELNAAMAPHVTNELEQDAKEQANKAPSNQPGGPRR